MNGYSYNAGTRRNEHQYFPFEKVEIDELFKLMPCVDRFPSAKNGEGFKHWVIIATSLDSIGIHIMRGIPRMAAHSHMSLAGTDLTADEIADPYSICFWNPDMYGIRPDKAESQLYYNSIMQLYAEWGVDFIKIDDICRMDMPSAKKEIEMYSKAIEECGRPIVLSLSPGPAKVEEAWCYEEICKYVENNLMTSGMTGDCFQYVRRCEHCAGSCFRGLLSGFVTWLPVGKLEKALEIIRDTRLQRMSNGQ